jgi:2'-5' RNA ligase
MRLFIGIPLPEQARAETAAALRRLKGFDWPVRWVSDEGLHVTLKFFGEVTTDRVDAIVEMLDFATKDMTPIALSLANAAVFPSAERPRVIHLAVDAEPSLELLQDRIERGSDPLGFPPEGRPFRPHLTLGRVREGQRLPAGWQSELERIPAGSAFLVDRVVLFESEIGTEGPSYRIRREAVLG